MSVLLWALLGLLVGGVLNHLADRLPKHQSVRGVPVCVHCGSARQRRQWVSALALVTGGARCRSCGKALPLRNWLLECGVALLYGYLAWRYGTSWKTALAALHASVLALVTVTDLETRIVPDAAVLPAAALTVVATFVTCARCVPMMLLGGVGAFLLFAILALIRPGAMGMGDVKLAGYVGLIAGYPRVVFSLVIAIVAGGVGAAVLLASGRADRRSYMPYAPYLALGGVLAVLFG